jgi:hypothetical protein
VGKNDLKNSLTFFGFFGGEISTVDLSFACSKWRFRKIVWPSQNIWTLTGSFLQGYVHIDWSPKFATGLKCLDRHRSKSIWVTILFFCQNDSLIWGSLWQKDRVVTYILFYLCLFKHFSPVTSFGDQSLNDVWCFEFFDYQPP